VGGHGYGLGAGWFQGCSRFVALVFQGGAYEGGEQRMRLQGLGLEFGVELAAEEPGMLRGFDDLDVIFVGGAAGDQQPSTCQGLLVIAIEFVAVAVAFADFELAVSAIRE